MIAVVFALKNELSGLVKEMAFKRVKNGGGLALYESRIQSDIILVEGGIGKDRAEETTSRVISELSPKAIVSAGFCGAVKPNAYSGEVLVCRNLYCLDGPPAVWSPLDMKEHHRCNEALMEQTVRALELSEAKYRLGDCLSLTYFASQSGLKSWIGRTFSVDIVDMESYWVGNAARERGVPFMALRTVLDTVDQGLPYFVGQTVESNGKGGALKALRYLAGNPRRALELKRLWEQAEKAQRSLSEVLGRALPGLVLKRDAVTSV